MSEVIVQTISKKYKDKIDAGIAYYTFICAINNIHLTPRQIQLLSYINYRGTISSSSSKEEFCNMFDSSLGTVSNMISSLSEIKLLVKEKGKIKLNPFLRLDLSKKTVIRLHLNIEENEDK